MHLFIFRYSRRVLNLFPFRFHCGECFQFWQLPFRPHSSTILWMLWQISLDLLWKSILFLGPYNSDRDIPFSWFFFLNFLLSVCLSPWTGFAWKEHEEVIQADKWRRLLCGNIKPFDIIAIPWPKKTPPRRPTYLNWTQWYGTICVKSSLFFSDFAVFIDTIW